MIGKSALAGLRRIFESGYDYKKAGVQLGVLAPKQHRQSMLFDNSEELERRTRLNTTIDRLNLKFGRGTINLAATGTEKAWTMRRQNLSPRYTTDWDALPEVR
ncbi:MAG: DUF4113 domain-containing protein [Panacagrimonas sp.]